jgi:cbb3-type cytochrome c oxidase subunit III
MAGDKHDIDAVTGVATTGHVWDDIRELDTPLPRWWLWVFYATIVWSIGYWIVYPSWPLVSSYTRGLFNWQSRDAVVSDLAALKVLRAPPRRSPRNARSPPARLPISRSGWAAVMRPRRSKIR